MDLRREEQRLVGLVSAAREDERSRWARELHDETLQSLAVLRMQLSAASGSGDVATLRGAINGAVAELGREIASLRALIADLRPAALDELGLRPALDTLFGRAADAHGLRVEAEIDLQERLDRELETTVYRLVQESLTNAGRHGGAERVRVRVAEQGDELTVTVADDGRGFDPERTKPGFGLAGMHDRVTLVGGRLQIRTSPHGTTVAATLPATRRRSADARPARSLRRPALAGGR